MSSYQVRPATLRDAKAVAEVHVAAWQAAYEGLMPDEHLKSMTVEKRQAFWREAIEFSEPQLLVATLGDQIVGFCGFDRSRDKGTPSTTGEIWAYYADPAHWGEGAGLALWDATLEACVEEGFTQLTLWVLLRNERALRFFEMAGFKRDMPSLKTVAAGTARLEEIRLKRPVG
ncbi:GNAT family N-acetyltransferase [soil metagenome]